MRVLVLQFAVVVTSARVRVRELTAHGHDHGHIIVVRCVCSGRQESCGTSMPHGFELECAGVVGGQATLCGGNVSFPPFFLRFLLLFAMSSFSFFSASRFEV